MAIIKNSILLAGVKGRIGGVVVKQYGDKIVISARPDMRHVVPTALQVEKREIFSAAVAYAKSIMRDRKLKPVYEKKLKEGETVYHFAIKEYYKKLKKGTLPK